MNFPSRYFKKSNVSSSFVILALSVSAYARHSDRNRAYHILQNKKKIGSSTKKILQNSSHAIKMILSQKN